jgi:hypothetical protein
MTVPVNSFDFNGHMSKGRIRYEKELVSNPDSVLKGLL